MQGTAAILSLDSSPCKSCLFKKQQRGVPYPFCIKLTICSSLSLHKDGSCSPVLASGLRNCSKRWAFLPLLKASRVGERTLLRQALQKPSCSSVTGARGRSRTVQGTFWPGLEEASICSHACLCMLPMPIPLSHGESVTRCIKPGERLHQKFCEVWGMPQTLVLSRTWAAGQVLSKTWAAAQCCRNG